MLGNMEKIPSVGSTNLVPDEVLAQAVASLNGWQWDMQGSIFDNAGIYVASSLTEAAAAMRQRGWFVPREAQMSGIDWHSINADVRENWDELSIDENSSEAVGHLVRESVFTLRKRSE